MSQGFTSPIGATGFYGLTPVGPTLPNVLAINGFVSNAGTGDIDLYTVPANRRTLVLSAHQYNTGLSSATYKFQVKIGGTYYVIDSQTAIADDVSSMATAGFVAEPGDILSINSNLAGGNFWLKALEFDASFGMYSPRLTTVVNGDNTLYTVPNGKSMYPYPSLSLAALGVMRFYQTAASSVAYNIYMVPNGGAAGTSNIAHGQGVPTGSGRSNTCVPCLNSGDFIVINSDNGGTPQFIFTTVIEI